MPRHGIQMTENSQEKVNDISPKISESFSYSWYPTQCEIGSSSREALTTNGSLSQESYRVFKTDADEEMVVVEQKALDQGAQRNPQFMLNLGNKFTDQQVRVLMKSWKELYDKRQHARTSESDWHDITDKVNMAPGCAKTVKQVKKKFKNLRDRYRVSKMKNRKKSFGLGKSVSYAQFEQVYGEIESQEGRWRAREKRDDASKKTASTSSKTGVTSNTTTSTSRLNSRESARNSQEAPKVSPSYPNAPFGTSHQSYTRSGQTIWNSISTTHLSVPHAQGHNSYQTTPSIRVAGREGSLASGTTGASEYLMGASTAPQRHADHGASLTSPSSAGHLQDSQLVNAVRELQQQQITMQRDLNRSMNQMEERILLEVSTKIRESEDRFRQQIANALSQLGNLIRIT